MKIKTDYEGCPYITAGKEYPVNEDWKIIDDDEQVITANPEEYCPHLDGRRWEIVEERFSQEVAQEMYEALVNILDMKGNVNYCLDGAEHDLSDIFELAGDVVNKLEKNDE